MTRRAAIRQADVDVLIRRAVACGLIVEAVEITVDGSVRILTHRPTGGVALNDDESWVDLAGQTQDHGRA
ncbi:MAG: hypothetical protein JWQ97_3399 [Phenylobacterium sp.]|nr:hypothetical protein [Phenylobacterium sp.]